MKRLSVILTVLLCSICSCYAQNEKTDSLKHILETDPDVDTKISAYTQLSRSYHNIDLEQAREYANQALELSKNANRLQELGRIYRSLADIAIKEDNTDEAKEYLLKAYNIFQEQELFRDLASVVTLLGNIEWVSNHLTNAMDYYLEAIELAEAHQIAELIPILHLNIGVINFEFQSYTDAINNFSAALKGFESQKDTLEIGNAYYNIGGVYFDMNDTSNARYYLNRARDLFLKINYNDGLARCNINIARLEFKKGDYDKSINLILEAIELIKQKQAHYTAPSSTALAPCNIILGDCYFHLKDYSAALGYYREGLDISFSNNRISDIKDASHGISESLEQLGRIDSSLYYYKVFKAYSDSLKNEDNIKKLAQQTAALKYEQRLKEEQEEREREAERRRMNNLIYGLVIAGLIFAIIILILVLQLWRNRLRRSQLEQANLKNELELRNKELTTHVMYQVKKNEFILNISKKLQAGIYKLKPENKRLVESVIRDLEMDSSDDGWKEFEVRFHNVHADYNKKLLQKYPDLTANELRLCAFLKLNMNTKEIAAITYQSTNSIDTARYRLRQKLGIRKDANLTAFLNQF